ncbi:hypothetical protein MCC93_24710 [Morococcus cerebrosus]|uniref:Uncharacterized protein n=1 Tax=Morococcus cerebrosus TaxID=1056807 RepID=A0A0C1GHE6_9NEIS|nr:hypothetical protein MCC93_24710 [Morococcus cerebrosus]
MYRKTRHYKGKQKDSLTSLNIKTSKYQGIKRSSENIAVTAYI